MINFKKAFAAAACCICCTAFITGCGADGIVNYTAPEDGEEVLVMTIKDHGDVKIKLFPDEAEKGVENIIGLAKKGYYDGLTFHRVIKDFMIQGGDPLGNGTGGESLWGEKFDGGTSEHLIHAAGAVAYANSTGPTTNGSQFYIVTGEKLTDSDIQMYDEAGYKASEEAQEIYKEDGGVLYLDGGYTVFGQVYDGLDIIFDIQNVETDGNDKPLEDVIIEKITVEEYDGEEVKFHMSDY